MTLTERLRHGMPAVRRPLGRIRAYVRRLRIWRDAVWSVRGAVAADEIRLLQSALAAPVTAARFLDRWRDPELLSDIRVQVRGVGAFTLRARTDDLYHVLPSRERAVVASLRTLLRLGDHFVDAGANIGFYTILGSRLVGATGVVTAIEMMPDTAAILRKHIALNKCANVNVVERALSNESGRRIRASVSEGKSGQATIARGAGDRTVEVEAVTLDLVLRNYPEIRLIKMDLEGAEALALQGASEVLARVRHVIFEEDYRDSEITKFLSARGFFMQRLDRRNCLATRSVD